MPKPTSELPESEVLPDPAQEKRQYRKFSAAEKQRILDAAEKCTQPGQLGALLRSLEDDGETFVAVVHKDQRIY